MKTDNIDSGSNEKLETSFNEKYFFYTDVEPGAQFNSKQSLKYERNHGRYDDEFYHDIEVSKRHKRDKSVKIDKSVARKAKREWWD